MLGEDAKFQRLRGDAFALSQVCHEGRQITIRQSRMMLHLRLSVFRQRMLEKTLPPCRVVARAMTAHHAPVQHRLDALTDTARRFTSHVPEHASRETALRWHLLLQHTQHMLLGDLVDRQLADDREGEDLQRVDELKAVLGVAP